MLLSVSLLGNCMVELEESCSKKRKVSQGNKAAHNSSRTSVLTKLLIIVCELAHKAVHSTQKIVYIRLCLYIIQVHEQFANCLRTFTNLVETFFAKYRILNYYKPKLFIYRLGRVSGISGMECWNGMVEWNNKIGIPKQCSQ